MFTKDVRYAVQVYFWVSLFNILPPLVVSDGLLFILLLLWGSAFCLDGCEIQTIKEEMRNYAEVTKHVLYG